MRNLEIMEWFENLTTLRESPVELPAVLSYAIARNYRTLLPIVEDIANAKKEVLLRYGEPTDKEGYYQISAQNMAPYSDEIKKLDDYDTDVSIYKVKTSAFWDLNFTVKQMEALYPMIAEEP